MTEDRGLEPPTIAEAIGDFVKGYRSKFHISRDALAQAGSALGMTWGTTSIENIEAGRFAPTLPTLFALGSALSALAWQEDRLLLSDLLGDAERVTIGSDFSVSTDRIRNFLGAPDSIVTLGDVLEESSRMLQAEAKRTTPLAERRAAKRLGVDLQVLQDAAWRLWSDTLEGIIVKSVGRDASPQARGHETRARVAELGAYLREQGLGG